MPRYCVISCDDPDIASTTVKWYDDCAFITQVESGTAIKQTLLLTREAAQQTIRALQEFLNPVG